MKRAIILAILGVASFLSIYFGLMIYEGTSKQIPEPFTYSLETFGGKIMHGHQNLHAYPKTKVTFSEAITWGENATLTYSNNGVVRVWRHEKRTSELSIEYVEVTRGYFLEWAGIDSFKFAIVETGVRLKGKSLVFPLCMGIVPSFAQAGLGLIGVMSAIFFFKLLGKARKGKRVLLKDS